MTTLEKTDTDFRLEIRAFLDRELPADWRGAGVMAPEEYARFCVRWRETLAENHLLGVAWPTEHGGAGLSISEQSVITEEFVRAGVPIHPLPNDALGFNLLAPTLLHWGSADQKARFLPGTLSGDIRWAQGYSEPDAGSDLFNLRTFAAVDGDELVINGQKTWTTAGLSANWLFALVRTDRTLARGRGLSFVLVDLDQSGVDVRGIRNLNGEFEFAEVFLANARASLSDVVGGLHNGAAVALSLLGYERGASGIALAAGLSIELDRIVDLAKSVGAWRNDVYRDRIASSAIEVELIRAMAIRALDAGVNGRPPGPESSILKSLVHEQRQVSTELAMDLLGRAAATPTGVRALEWQRPQPRGTDPLSSAAWADDLLNSRAGTIYGGSSEIQRNTVAEQVLGLPREPRPAPTGSGAR